MSERMRKGNEPKPSDPLPPWGSTPGQCPDITLASVFTLRDLDHLEAVMSGAEPGYIYARDGHPNSQQLAEKLAALEGAEAGMVFPSGMAAITALLFDRLRPGRRVVADAQLYGKTTSLVDWLKAWFGVEVVFANLTDDADAKRAIIPGTTLVFGESLSNPLLRWSPLDRLAAIAHDSGALLAIDNTFSPPPVVRPIDLGADVVVHSLTKIISGHSDVTMGCLLGSKDLIQSIRGSASILGYHTSAFDCWLVERSLESLDLRVRAACANAAQLADILAKQPAVRRVVYPGQENHPDHAWGQSRAPLAGYMICFELADRESVNRLLQNLQHVRFCPSLGDARTTVSHPASTSHRSRPLEERLAQGIADGHVRVSVGVEKFELVKDDFESALKAL